MGLAFLIPSIIILYVALTADAETIDGPNWVGVAFALMFVNAGITILLLDSMFNPLRESIWFPYFQLGVLLSIPLILTILLNWVAFGPGEREFSGGISIPFIGVSFGRNNQILGRIVFGIPALILDIIAGISIFAVVRNYLGYEEETTDE